MLGIAGVGRSLGPTELRAELMQAFSGLAALGPAVLQHKVCSTFDSSPARGSIGVAIETARGIAGLVDERPIAIEPAQPEFGRFTVFGTQFAADGSGAIMRLDRHPTMSCHPTTPMAEADL